MPAYCTIIGGPCALRCSICRGATSDHFKEKEFRGTNLLEIEEVSELFGRLRPGSVTIRQRGKARAFMDYIPAGRSQATNEIIMTLLEVAESFRSSEVINAYYVHAEQNHKAGVETSISQELQLL